MPERPSVLLGLDPPGSLPLLGGDWVDVSGLRVKELEPGVSFSSARSRRSRGETEASWREEGLGSELVLKAKQSNAVKSCKRSPSDLLVRRCLSEKGQREEGQG